MPVPPAGGRGLLLLVLLLLAVFFHPSAARSVSDTPPTTHRRHRHDTPHDDTPPHDTPRLHDRLKWPSAEEEEDGRPLSGARWAAVSRAAVSLGRTVARLKADNKHAPAPQPAAATRRHRDDHDDVYTRHDDDDDDVYAPGDVDDDVYPPHDDVDEDGVPFLKNPHHQVELNDDDDEDGDDDVTGDVFPDDQTLRLTGTPRPALITSEDDPSQRAPPPETEVSDQLMRDDSAAAERMLRTEGARPRKQFKPVRMPTHFASYDVDPRDGRVTLQELVNVTGAKVNVERAFNDSDKNGDGFLDRDEFYSAPWKLGPGWRHWPAETDLTRELESDEDEDEDEDMYDDEDEDEDEDDEDDEWDEWDEWEDEWGDDADMWNDINDADIF